MNTTANLMVLKMDGRRSHNHQLSTSVEADESLTSAQLAIDGDGRMETATGSREKLDLEVAMRRRRQQQGRNRKQKISQERMNITDNNIIKQKEDERLRLRRTNKRFLSGGHLLAFWLLVALSSGALHSTTNLLPAVSCLQSTNDEHVATGSGEISRLAPGETLETAPSSPRAAAADEPTDATPATGSAPFDYHSSMPVITKRELAEAVKQATASVRNLRDSREPQMSPASGWWAAGSVFHRASPDWRAANQSEQALISEEATRLLAKRHKLNREQTLRGLPLISVDQTQLGKSCPRSSRHFNCVPGVYRSLTGHCNNVQNPEWGAAQTPLVRYAPAHYADNVARPLESGLPSPRAVSVALYEAAGSGADQTGAAHHPHMTTLMSFFGQFLFHDLAFVSQYSPAGPSGPLKCCPDPRSHPECMPVEHSDGFCLDYARSAAAVRSGCNLGPRDQLNLVSSYLDGSAIYGSNEEQMRRLRTFTGGRLRSQRAPTSLGTNQQTGSSELLPQIKLSPQEVNGTSSSLDAVWRAAADECRLMAQMRRRSSSVDSSDSTSRCFQAGDIRANENIGLTLMHTIWMREHNQLADRLSQLNKHWRDERLFEETRRIVIAQLQHIAYSEFLPSILGADVMSRFNLSAKSQGYSQSYDPQLNGGVSNELAAAVFPLILSTLPSALDRYSERLEMLGTTPLADTFMDASDLGRRNRFGQYLMGMISQNAMEPALGLMPMTMQMELGQAASGVSRQPNGNNNNLRPRRATSGGNQTTGSGSGDLSAPQVDIVALTLQQGRDHGLRGYLFWRQSCQLKPAIRSWQDLAQVMPAQVVERLRSLYSSVHQLDLYLGILETPMAGALVGPTFVCLLARQFFQLKHADRYWYENDLPGTAFEPGQLEEIRQSSLAKVVCRNSQSALSFIQPAPMITSDPYLNAYQYCTNKAMVELDLSRWREPVQSAQQLTMELLMSDLLDREASLNRGARLAEANVGLVRRSLRRAKRQLEEIAGAEQLNRERRAAPAVERLHHRHYHATSAGAKVHAGYRYLPRLKRQALRLNNQSLIFELATNEVVRSLLRQGKDRESGQSIQSDIRDFLFSLESVQLDNLIDNSVDSQRLQDFIQQSGGHFLTQEQRTRLQQAGDPLLAEDPLLPAGGNSALSSSVSANCQDDERAFPCDHTTPYRTITGWCNNLQQPKFGQSFTAHHRILPNAYDDGLSRPRQSSVLLASPETGERLPLPSARLISTTMHEDRSQLHARYSLALMQFGQFGVDHDLTRTPFSVALDGSLLDCSACDSQRTVHRDCLPIEVPDDDAHFQSPKARELTASGQVRKKCLHFVRSLNGQTALGPRQQINALTAYLDASNIYGSDNCEAKSLRSFSGGRLNSSHYPALVTLPSGASLRPREILPVTRANPECATPNGLCFHAGDQRASEQPGLTAIHTVFMRLHNSVAREMAQVNRHWQDERLYQEARRVVGAIMQRITYNEFAPRLLGLDYMSRFDLMLKNVGYSNHYDESCSANILTEFAAAAFRMGHSLIRNSFPLLNKQYKQIGKAFQLRKAFFNSQRILTEPTLIDSILRGVVTTPIETLDNAITEELTNHLFERPKEPFSGMDLISLNIQRARDHGIAGYNKYRVKCNLTRARSFDDLAGEISAKLIKRLQSLYASVDDIDLFTGGMSELPVHGGIIGPTLGCIIGMQLSRLKRCDRFWHETSDPWVRFSAPQLAEIRKMTLSKVICQESDNIDAIQRNAMDVSDHYLNPRVACSNLPTMDFSAWRENQKSCLVNKIKLELGQTKRVNPCRSCTCTLEGPVCRTAKINCLQAMKQANLGTIMADKSCLVQCAWALDMQQ